MCVGCLGVCAGEQRCVQVCMFVNVCAWLCGYASVCFGIMGLGGVCSSVSLIKSSFIENLSTYDGDEILAAASNILCLCR